MYIQLTKKLKKQQLTTKKQLCVYVDEVAWSLSEEVFFNPGRRLKKSPLEAPKLSEISASFPQVILIEKRI